jgi:putative heme transporter
LPKPLGRIVKILLFLLIVEYLVIPQFKGTHKALDLIGKVNLLYLAAGIGLEVAAVIAYTQLTRAVLPSHDSPSRSTLLRIQLATLSVSHVVPGGSAAGTSLGYRLLTQAGVDAPDAGFALATQGLGSAVVLNALLWLALVISIPLNGFSSLYLTAALVGAILIGGFSLLILLLTRGEERAANLFQSLAARTPLVDEEAIGRLVHRLAARLRELGHDRRLLVRAISWATANWLLDAASLWVFVAAFGHRVRLDGLLVSFGLAYVLAAIPVTPGGLGVVEAVLTSSLVGFGTPAQIALFGVLAYRLVNFWLPIPLGGVAYLSLQVVPGDNDDGARQARRLRREHALRRLVEPLIGSNEGRREWARRHGIKL